MSDNPSLTHCPANAEPDVLPLGGLLALACAGFITILTEAMPAGLLPQMGAGLGVSPALVGQLVTLYALGSLLAAIPLTLLTRGWRRRPLLLVAIAGFALVNSVTAVSSHYGLTLVARFFAGVFAGLLWALLAGYASRMVAPHLQGRAIAIAMLGAPLALTLGVPAGTLLGTLVGWRLSFAIMTGLTLALLLWARWQLPDFAGQAAQQRLGLRQVVRLRGIRPVLWVTFTYVLAHNILYTYIAPLLEPAGIQADIDRGTAGVWPDGVVEHLAGGPADRSMAAPVGAVQLHAVWPVGAGVGVLDRLAGDHLHRRRGLGAGIRWPTGLAANRPGQVGGRVGGRRAVDAGDGMEPGHCRWRSGGRVVAAELGRARVSLGGSGVDVADPLQTPMKKPPVFSGRGLFIQTEISTS